MRTIAIHTILPALVAVIRYLAGPPATKPLPAAPDAFYSGLAGPHPDFTPRGVQKFEWNPEVQALREAWVNLDACQQRSDRLERTGSRVHRRRS